MPARRSRLVSPAHGGALAESLAGLRATLGLPDAFDPEVIAEAEASAASVSTDPAVAGLEDLRDIAFITIDPPGATDLDQALHLRRTPDGAALHYAIADVPAYVAPDGEVDREARLRGQTMYAPDGRVPLHPTVISEHAASLLPGADRRAFVWSFTLDEAARPVETTLRGAIVRSHEQWSYQDAQAAVDDGRAHEVLHALAWFGPLRAERERERGGASLNIPETEIIVEDGTYRLERRRPLPVEEWNAQVSLMTGMAAADIMLRGGVGILRTMPPASDDDIAAFRVETAALGIPWALDMPYGDFLRSLDREDPAALAVRDAAARLFRGAGYAAFDGDAPEEPDQAAIGAPYAHTTAPLRRLVDRWSLVICEALAQGRPVPDWARSSLAELPKLMGRSAQRASQLEAGALDRVEAALMSGGEGELFTGVVLGMRGDGARVQLVRPPVAVKVEGIDVAAGSTIRLRLDSADIATGILAFTLVDGG